MPNRATRLGFQVLKCLRRFALPKTNADLLAAIKADAKKPMQQRVCTRRDYFDQPLQYFTTVGFTQDSIKPRLIYDIASTSRP